MTEEEVLQDTLNSIQESAGRKLKDMEIVMCGAAFWRGVKQGTTVAYESCRELVKEIKIGDEE